MRKLLALLGVVAITSSTTGLLTDSVTMNKPIIGMKTESKKMVTMNTAMVDVGPQSDELTTMEISTLNQESQQWDDAKIDKILKHSLEYHHHQLTINQKKLDIKSLPSEVSKHLNLALAKLNDVVDQGVVKVVVKNKEVQLVYPDSGLIMKATDTKTDDIYYYDDANTMRAESAYMWFTKYGPKPWWKFWKWGVYLHFSESAVIGAGILGTFAEIINLRTLFKEGKEIQKTIEEIKSAKLTGNIPKVNAGLAKILKKLPGLSLEYLGNVFEAIAPLATALSFILTFYSGGFFKAIFDLVTEIIVSVTEKILETDKGKGVKWQLMCYVIPGHFFAE